MGLQTDFSPKFCWARIRVRQIAVFPDPAGPRRKTDHRTSKISRSCEIFSLKTSSDW